MPTTVDLTGHALGQYEIRELVYNGTITANYDAFQPSLERLVTIQTLQKHLRHDTRNNQALAKAARLIATYEHPNIVPILDFGIQDGITYVVMRRSLGGTLKDKLENGALSPLETVAILKQVANALEYVHSLGHLHTGLGKVNIVFDTWGSAYLADFIVAGFLSELDEALIGIPAYMPPEHWQEKPLTPASDQYALAAVTYEMISGSPPFRQPGLVTKHLTEPPPPIQGDLPKEINDVLGRALAKTPEERYPTVLDFARDFEQVLTTTSKHLFVSYSRRDKEYAQALKDHLIHNGFNLWIDDAIEHGDQWFNEIHDAIKSCTAFIVLMSPSAEGSEWVQKEILLAKRYKKPIFPLLLSGQEFAILIDIQYADVRDRELPGTDFHRRVSRAVYGTG